MKLTPEQKTQISASRDNQQMTRRAISPGMENHLHTAYPILDHGFVRVVDYMGNDEAIAQAARVSYGTGTKTAQDDAGLIRYLMRHWHSTPFEMCLSGDTKVPHFAPSGVSVKWYTMRELAEAFEVGGKENSWVKILKIRTVNPTTGVVTGTKIKNAWKTGVRSVYRITTGAPFFRSIKVTDNHRIMTPNGFGTLADGLKIGSEVMLNGSKCYGADIVSEIVRRRDAGETQKQIHSAMGVAPATITKYAGRMIATGTRTIMNPDNRRVAPEDQKDVRHITRSMYPKIGTCETLGCSEKATDRHHIDENPANNLRENVSFLCAKHHRHVHTNGLLSKAISCKIAKIEYVGVEDVYDLETVDSNHTFVAEGIIVHNCEIKLHVKLPVFVARQWIRHRTANVNEYSARYSILDREFYIPEIDNLAKQSTTNNQGRTEPLQEFEAEQVREILRDDANRAYDHYQNMIDPEGVGLARELARINLPANIYTQWYWKVDLHNLFHFLRLRADAHAQYEIRVYADLICKLVAGWVPEAYAAFQEYRLGGTQLSHSGLEAVQAMLRGETVTRHTAGMSAGEWREFQAVIDSKPQPT